MLFNRLDLDTEEILKAAGTKWSILPFRFGLVGVHCIGVVNFPPELWIPRDNYQISASLPLDVSDASITGGPKKG